MGNLTTLQVEDFIMHYALFIMHCADARWCAVIEVEADNTLTLGDIGQRLLGSLLAMIEFIVGQFHGYIQVIYFFCTREGIGS